MMLTRLQKDLLMEIDRTGSFTEEDMKTLPGLHFCPEWDEIPVCDDSPESEFCKCNIPEQV